MSGLLHTAKIFCVSHPRHRHHLLAFFFLLSFQLPLFLHHPHPLLPLLHLLLLGWSLHLLLHPRFDKNRWFAFNAHHLTQPPLAYVFTGTLTPLHNLLKKLNLTQTSKYFWNETHMWPFWKKEPLKILLVNDSCTSKKVFTSKFSFCK